MLNGTLKLHDITDTERYCQQILTTHLRQTNATLKPEDQEELLSYLIEETWRLSLTFDPARNTSFSKYLYQQLPNKAIDWYRQRFYRDQRSQAWYRRTYPTAPPADPDGQRNFAFPTSLDTDAATDQPAPDHSGRDPLAFAIGTLTGDPAADCDPALANILSRGHSREAEHLRLRRKDTDARAQRRMRKAA